MYDILMSNLKKMIKEIAVFLMIIGIIITTYSFSASEELPLRDVAYGSILTSGGEAINAIARYVNPNDDAFVSLMNRRVKELGLKHTHFVNIEGLDSFGHMANAKNLTEMLAWALEDDFVRQVYTTDYWRTSPSYYHGEGLELGSWALQDLRYRLQGIDALGVKTGTTWDAGFCAMGLIRKDGVEYIITLMGIPYYGEHDTPQVEFFKKLADAI